MKRPAHVLACGSALVLLLSACTGTSGSEECPPNASCVGAPGGEVTVFAAASLTEPFTTLAHDFETEHPANADGPGITVRLSFGPSSGLAQQLVAGAPAGVFASADTATMALVVDAGLASDPTVFVTNTLEIAVPPGNPGHVTGLADFADPDLAIALCAPEVPCGSAATKVLDQAGVSAAPDTLEEDVKATLTKVELGEVDAALVYRSDVVTAGDRVQGIEIPQIGQVVNDYPIVVLDDAPNRVAAQAFVTYVRSPAGLAVLTSAGFARP